MGTKPEVSDWRQGLGLCSWHLRTDQVSGCCLPLDLTSSLVLTSPARLGLQALLPPLKLSLCLQREPNNFCLLPAPLASSFHLGVPGPGRGGARGLREGQQEFHFVFQTSEQDAGTPFPPFPLESTREPC